MLRRTGNIVRSLRNERILNNLKQRATVFKDQKCRYGVQMNEDAKLYNTANNITRRDVTMYLDEYAPKFKWREGNTRILDVGCADGSVTQLLNNYIPKNYEALIGCDLSEKMVKFANENYSDRRTRFFKLDIRNDLPRELNESFDYVFSFYAFNWVKNQEEAFMNIHKLLKHDGGCFMLILAYTPSYIIFRSLAKSDKWAPYLKDVNKMISPYNDMQNPDTNITEILKKIGFQTFDVRCKQTIYVYESTNELKDLTKAIHPFNFPKDSMNNEFADDFVQLAREMRLFDETNDTYKFHYNLMAVHCTK